MVTVTEKAREELGRLVATTSIANDKCLRLTTPPEWVGEGDFGIVIDVERNGDRVIDHQDLKVLLIDPSLAKQLSSSVLDFKNPPDGPRFTLDVYHQDAQDA